MIKTVFFFLLLSNSAQASFNPGNLVNGTIQPPAVAKHFLPRITQIFTNFYFKIAEKKVELVEISAIRGEKPVAAEGDCIVAVNEFFQIEDKDTLPNLISIKDSLDYKWLLNNDIFYLSYKFENIEIIGHNNFPDSTFSLHKNFAFDHIAIFKNRYLIKKIRFLPCNYYKDFVVHVVHYKTIDGQIMMSTEFLDSSSPFYCTSYEVSFDSILSILNFYIDKTPTREWVFVSTEYKEKNSFILNFLLRISKS